MSKDIFSKLKLGDEITVDEYRKAIIAAHKSRTIISYLIWKNLKERYPQVDADQFMIQTYREFGRLSGEKWGEINSASEALYKQSSKSGFLVFEQELIEYSEDYAQKNFKFCPHIEALKELHATEEEMAFFCQEILSAGDYGNMDPHPCVQLEFKKQIGAGDDHCEYCITRVKK